MLGFKFLLMMDDGAGEKGPLAALSSILESTAALVPQQAAMAARKGGGANGGQPLGGLFSRSLLLPWQQQWQEAASLDSWPQVPSQMVRPVCPPQCVYVMSV